MTNLCMNTGTKFGPDRWAAATGWEQWILESQDKTAPLFDMYN